MEMNEVLQTKQLAVFKLAVANTDASSIFVQVWLEIGSRVSVMTAVFGDLADVVFKSVLHP